jgi:hypothetical protein
VPPPEPVDVVELVINVEASLDDAVLTGLDGDVAPGPLCPSPRPR